MSFFGEDSKPRNRRQEQLERKCPWKEEKILHTKNLVKYF